jgi:hypothetical protein
MERLDVKVTQSLKNQMENLLDAILQKVQQQLI